MQVAFVDMRVGKVEEENPQQHSAGKLQHFFTLAGHPAQDKLLHEELQEDQDLRNHQKHPGHRQGIPPHQQLRTLAS
jgi:hypothetical protein